MPKIKAYRNGTSIIPIDRAKMVTAYSCPWTGRLFGKKKDYVAYLRVLRTDRMHKRIRENAYTRKLEDLWNRPSFEDIVGWINRNPDFILENGLRSGCSDRQINAIRDTYWLRITYLTLDWSDSVSNSHSCPHDGVTNWGGRDTYGDGMPKPKGYPGWSGRIEWETSHDIRFGWGLMRSLRIHTGTGGGVAGNRFGYEVKLFESDWPGLREWMIFNRLSESNSNNRYTYGTPWYFR